MNGRAFLGMLLVGAVSNFWWAWAMFGGDILIAAILSTLGLTVYTLWNIIDEWS